MKSLGSKFSGARVIEFRVWFGWWCGRVSCVLVLLFGSLC